ncbi:MAG: tagatose 1,6-diphosphate aldolase [Bradyrhizobium sp.]|uniref:tagatose 1,6-diphosphate aldolase n=1 Tax=Bradyrhizobium sp. TaxID=376 RepID=UPI001229D7AE|nr:tagatose 1,6-diphosphate aldolase [Bradyrhizobium sp.]THD67266.1 MAG: tagatose 1,6-diphosphate aldolase [Bradyrhizobium sp.]
MRTIGKTRGLARLADAEGHFRMVALDQRPPMFEAIAQAKKITKDQVTYADVTAAKRLLVKALAPHCSSMLFDPNFAVPAAIDLMPARCGLIMTLEEHRVEETAGGRKSRVIDNWSVAKIRAMGGDAVKVLAWYRPEADAAINAHQHRFVREIGDECRRNDIPYVLELLVYPFLGSANHTADYVESPGKLPSLVIESVREFAKPEYGVDLLKLESPLAANALPPRDGSLAADAAQREFDAIGEICSERGIPWVLLSGGAARDKFERVLDYAYAAGAGGFLAGRTIWLDAVRMHFPDLAAVSAALNKESVATLNSLSKLTKERAHSWQPCFPTFDHVQREGDFARAY